MPWTGNAPKARREEANLTQQEAALRLGLTQAYLSMLERGRRPGDYGTCCRGSECILAAAQRPPA
ncbi:helix-turn-helix domain-containing protein [Acidicapsa dinghuensis]|uniref:Helix-turn-helix domain-containing protein n=1 Tax=Acidicapsa dinghuensis TaxID=2218256 RepID=A0ABW1EL76_9BACT